MRQHVDPLAEALAVFLVAMTLVAGRPAAPEEAYAQERAAMIRAIEGHARAAPEALGRGVIDPKVLAVMGDLERHAFVPDDLQGAAYDDRPLPIGWGQTISQPFIVALMTDLAAVGPEAVVLEVGTGSGYQAAVLARLVRTVHSIEIIPELAEQAKERLARRGHANVRAYQGDGYYGVEAAAPFDAIVVTAAARHVPPPLLEQLKPGGRMVIPVGSGFALQHLMLIEKAADGRVRTRQTLPVAFVPLTGAR